MQICRSCRTEINISHEFLLHTSISFHDEQYDDHLFVRSSVCLSMLMLDVLLLQVLCMDSADAFLLFPCRPLSFADHLHFITWRSASARRFWQKRAGGGGRKHQKKRDSNENHIVIPHSRSAGEQQRPTDDLNASDVSDPLRRSRCDERWPPLM